MTNRMKIVHEVALAAEGFYDKARDFGKQAATALKENKRAQITGLESVANDSMKVTDVFNYIKTRTARQSEWRDQNFGFELLAYLEKDMGNKRNDLISKLSLARDTKESQEVYILLIREFVRQLAAQYEYEFALLKKEDE